MSQFMERLKEPSTWRGIVVLLSLFGVTISPEDAQAILTVGGLVYSMIQILRKEKKGL